MRGNTAICVICIAVGLTVGAIMYVFLRWQGVKFGMDSMRSIVSSAAVLLAIGGIMMYLLLRWWGGNVAGSPLGAVVFIVAVNLLTGVLLALVTGDRGQFWSFGKAALYTAPLLYGIIWGIRKFIPPHHAP